jgi:2-(1,2-epoxy-1,2-dihydrophenyl)acetyl-CoA isomerase
MVLMAWIDFSVGGPVATITLGAPSGPSRINVESAKEWLDALNELERDAAVAVIVIKADGPVWNAGGDLPEFRERGGDAHDFVLEIGDWINPVVSALYRSAKLTVASVHGAVAGGGLGPMLACDVVIAADDTKLTLGYSKLATNPDAGVSWFLPRLVGRRKALELYLTSELLSAEDARALGIVNFVVPRGELESATADRVDRFAALSPHAVKATKQLLRSSEEATLESHLDAEIRSFADNTRHPDFAEGVAAFIERRDPEFGRQ